MGKCNSCSKSNTSCTCKKKPEPCCNSCTEKVSTNCVIYDVTPNRSNLTCFLGVNNGTSLTKILEILDKKLCIPVSKCAKEKLGLGYETDISMAVIKMLEYICQQEDVKIKVSEEDASNGYLFEKVTVGDCIKKSISTDYLGNESLKLELDFPCIEDKLSCCGGNNTSISIQGANTVCGNNSTLLTAVSNCSTPIVWSNGLTGPTIQATAGIYYATCGGRQSNIITITSTGNCGCIPIWRDATPLAIFCGESLGYNPCKKYIKQSNQCNNDIQWVEYTGSNSDGSECPGCGPAQFTATRTQTFLRNNCGSGCTPGSVTFNKTYSSTISQAVADTLAVNDNNFLTEGQNFANATGTCTGANCSNPFYNASRTASFTRNNCPSGCTSVSVPFTKSYTSYTSQVDANNMATNDTNFNSEGQTYANTKGICSGANCGGCVPTNNFTCSSNGTNISYSDSCGTVIGTTSLNNPSVICSTISNKGNVSLSHTDTNGFNASSYTIEYAITSINGTPVTSPTYQGSSQFNNLDHNSAYVFTMRTLRAGQFCTVSKTATIGNCTSCTDPSPTIPSYTISSTDVCTGGSATLDTSGCNGNYRIEKWNGSSWDFSAGGATNQYPLQPGKYKVGCSTCSGTVFNVGEVDIISHDCNIVCKTYCVVTDIANPNADYIDCTGNNIGIRRIVGETAPIIYNTICAKEGSVTGGSSINLIGDGCNLSLFCGCCFTSGDLSESSVNCLESTYQVTVNSFNGCDTNVEYGYSTTNDINTVTNWGFNKTITVSSNNVTRYFFMKKNGCTSTYVGSSIRNCTPVCVNPYNNSLVKSSQDANGVTIVVGSDNGDTYLVCDGASFTCSNNCGSAQSLGSFYKNVAPGNSVTITVRIYKGTCECYTDITQTFTNTSSTCTNPSGLALTKISEDGSAIVIRVDGTNGTGFRYCNNSSFTCTNSCNPPDGSVGNTFTFGLPANQTTTLTVRVYNGTDCNCYTDITQTFSNNSAACNTYCITGNGTAMWLDCDLNLQSYNQIGSFQIVVCAKEGTINAVTSTLLSTGCNTSLSCNCITTSWTPLEIYRCQNGISEQQESSDQCSGVTQWIPSGNACTNNVAGLASSTIDYYKTCPSGCTANAIPYSASSTVNIGSVSASSIDQANTDAQTQANNNVNTEQAANGQNNANNTPDNLACNCPCVESWSGTGQIVCFSDIPSGEPVSGTSASCWRYEKQTNQCNSNVRWVQSSEDMCNCTPCLFDPILSDISGTEYCDGTNCMIQQQNQCGQVVQPRLVQANCTTCQCVPNWVDDGINYTCGQNIGQDPCKVYKQQIDGCGNTRWVFDHDEPTCGGCTPPCLSLADISYTGLPSTITWGGTYTATTDVQNLLSSDVVRILRPQNTNGAPAYVETTGGNSSITFTIDTDTNLPQISIQIIVYRSGCPNVVYTNFVNMQ